jgi:hypothetical protein
MPGVPILPGFEKIFILELLLSFFGSGGGGGGGGTVFSGALVDGDGSVGASSGCIACRLFTGMFMAAVAWKMAAAVVEVIIEPASGGDVGDGSVADRLRIDDCIG